MYISIWAVAPGPKKGRYLITGLPLIYSLIRSGNKGGCDKFPGPGSASRCRQSILFVDRIIFPFFVSCIIGGCAGTNVNFSLSWTFRITLRSSCRCVILSLTFLISFPNFRSFKGVGKSLPTKRVAHDASNPSLLRSPKKFNYVPNKFENIIRRNMFALLAAVNDKTWRNFRVCIRKFLYKCELFR